MHFMRERLSIEVDHVMIWARPEPAAKKDHPFFAMYLT